MPATLEQVRNHIARIDATADADRLETFAARLLEKADPGFLEAFDADALAAMASDAYAFLDQAGGEGVHVEAFRPTFEVDGWDAPYSVVRLALPDRPFIVDSVRAGLRRFGVDLYHLLHPILRVTRDDDGRVRALGDPGGRFEAFEMYFVEPLPDEAAHERLRAAVERVLRDVVLATDDYRALRARARWLSEELVRTKGTGPGDDELEEYRAFLEWLDDDNFVYLGYREYDVVEADGRPSLMVRPDTALGILRKTEESAYREPVPLDELPEGLRARVVGGPLLTVTKTNAEATVHRPARMDYVGLKKRDENGPVLGEHRLLGLFTSKALSTPVHDTPILRRKLRQVLDRDAAIPDSHDYKEIVTIFDSMPRSELFWTDAAALHEDIRTVMALEQERGVRLIVRRDPLQRGLAVMVIMPRERFNADVRRRIQAFLAERLGAGHVDYHLAMGEDQAQVRFHFFFTTDVQPEDVNVRDLERDVAERTRTWEDHVRDRLATELGGPRGRELADRYLPFVEERYKADTAPAAAVRDLRRLAALDDREYRVDLLNPVEGGRDAATRVKVYHRYRPLVLSEVLPLLENLGFFVLEQVPYQFRLEGERRGIDVFEVRDAQGAAIDVKTHRARLVEALEELLEARAENDRLNRLVLYAGLTLRQVGLLRAYAVHVTQLEPGVSRRFLFDTLLAHPAVARLAFERFTARFDPALQGDRAAAETEAAEAFAEAMADVASLPEDRALRAIEDLIAASVRSNYYRDSETLSFKLDCSRVATMPEPRPVYEIAVCGRGMEGVHLRGGKVARGGIRWSERPDDFRTEVLGLMKTQMTKNAVIVPVGSKGGFVVKGAPEDRDALREHVRAQYGLYVRALLDLTDDREGDRVVHPRDVVVHDEDDPYLVVAADKGTATFSDFANDIAEEYGFWLGDAFASGGAHGYDHKEEAITARGAWRCVRRHFREMGRDPLREPFTTVGIGDMSGDVFGNGMLRSRSTRLLAAFDHRHVFLDPDPDPEAAFDERARLFGLSRSTWADYDRAKISEGGGVFPRDAKSIPLGPRAREALGVEAEALSGPELVRAVLRAPVDLLWNGGIGTYVKAASERHAEVGDGANDAVRVDAHELRCKVVGEGGNLGFTQLGRVAYALAGGRINTDAIDNSGGVDMSDHEVNLKVLLQPLAASGELSAAQRNRLLDRVTDDVSALVLRNNDRQSLALSLAERRAARDPGLFASLQAYHEERGDLRPEVEDLPSERELTERRRQGRSWTRPELAILLAYTKMGIYRRLLETDFPDEPHFEHYLHEYFPEAVFAAHPEAVKAHPLRREIIATQFTNTVVDLLGVTFVHRTLRDAGATPVEVIRAALVAMEILEVPTFVDRVDALETVDADGRYDAMEEIVRAVEGLTNWMLLNDLTGQAVQDFVDTYRGPLARLRFELAELLPAGPKRAFRRAVKRLRGRGFEEEAAVEIASFEHLPTSIAAIEVSRARDVPLEEAVHRFYALGDRLRLGWLRERLEALPTDGKWEKVAVAGLIMDLRRAQGRLTAGFVGASAERSAERYLQSIPNLLRRIDPVLFEMTHDDGVDLASATVLVRLLDQAAAGGVSGGEEAA